MKYSLATILFLVVQIIFSQVTFYQDVFKGGVSGSGFMGTNEGVLRIVTPQNSSIKKAFLFCGNSFNDSIEHSIYLNGKEFVFSENTRVSLNYNSFFLEDIVSTHVIDLTNKLDFTEDSIVIFSPQLPSNSYFFYQDFFLLVVYENINYPTISVSVDVIAGNIEQTMINNHILNKPMYSKPISLSLLTGHMVDFLPDSTDVYLNNNNFLGRIGGAEQNCDSRAGVFGNFYYQNDTLYGFNDDTPDSLMR